MRRDPALTALLCGLSFLAGVCLMDAGSRQNISYLVEDNATMARIIAKETATMEYMVSTADPRWATPLQQIARRKH